MAYKDGSTVGVPQISDGQCAPAVFFSGTFSIDIFTRTVYFMQILYLVCRVFNVEFFNSLVISDREKNSIDNK